MNNTLPVVDTATLPEGVLFVDLRGRRFNRWTVYGYAGQTRFGQTRWHCICECGVRKIVTGWVLERGESGSCGCLRLELSRVRKHKHGMSRSPEHSAWKNMKTRCLSRHYREWHYYGGRGIKVAKEWIDDFSAFYKHVGPRPGPDYSLDRINNDGNYEPGNVRRAKRVMQSRNRSNAVLVKIDGDVMHLTDAVKAGPVTMTTYRRRLRLGWTPQAAISTPARVYPRGTVR